MSFFAVLFALLVEQLKPLPRGGAVHEALVAWMRWTARNFDAGREHHPLVVWLIGVVLPALAAWGVHAALAQVGALAALAWSVAVLYLTLGFRQFSHYFTDIRDALDRGDEDAARALLSEWRHLDASELPRTELLRHVIEHSLLAAHRHVFGVFFWFVACFSLGLGPAGAVLYRMAEVASRHRSLRSRAVDAPEERLAALAQRLYTLVDRVPARLTAFGFAVVGNFEEAVNGWRRDAALWKHANEGIILSAAAGAVGLRLGGASAPAALDRGGVPDSGFHAMGQTPGDAPVHAHLRSIVGLVWRSMVLWMLLLALLSLANLVG